MQRFGVSLIVYGGKVPSLDETCANNRISIANLRDEMNVSYLGQRTRKAPTNLRDARPFRICGFRYEQNTIFCVPL